MQYTMASLRRTSSSVTCMCSNLFVTVYAFASSPLLHLRLPLEPTLIFAERPPLRRSVYPLIVNWGVVLTFVPRRQIVGAA